MKREIYLVLAYVVDANGTFNNLSGYPKTFDSKKAIALLGDRAAECYNVKKVGGHNALNLNDK